MKRLQEGEVKVRDAWMAENDKFEGTKEMALKMIEYKNKLELKYMNKQKF